MRGHYNSFFFFFFFLLSDSTALLTIGDRSNLIVTLRGYVCGRDYKVLRVHIVVGINNINDTIIG